METANLGHRSPCFLFPKLYSLMCHGIKWTGNCEILIEKTKLKLEAIHQISARIFFLVSYTPAGLEIDYRMLNNTVSPDQLLSSFECVNYSSAVTDLKLQIKYDIHWQRKLQLIQQRQGQEQNGQSSNSGSNILNLPLSLSSTPEVKEEKERSMVKMMNLQLYRATIDGDQGKFIDTLVSVSTDKGLSATAILNQVTPLGNSVLHLAANFGHQFLAGHLASNFPHLLLTTNRRSDTPFILAARSGHKQTAYIISRFAEDSPNCCSGLVLPVPQPDLMLRMTNKDGNTALHEALIANHEEMVNYLLPTDLEVTFSYANALGKTPFYIAIETGQINIVQKMLQLLPVPTSEIFKIAGKSHINAAIKTMNTDMLMMVCEKIPSLIYTKDEDGGTPLHCAASVGYYKGVEFLLNRHTELILEYDNHGLLPIHIASQKGHLEIMKKLLHEYLDSMELLTFTSGENILHIASKFGRIGIVKYVLETPHLGILVNQKDDNGNTPLHVATRNWFPKIVSCLTWKEGVDLNLVNDDGMTALDIAEEFGGISPSFRKRLTWIALKAAGAEPNKYPYNKQLNLPNNQIIESPAPNNRVDYKDRVNTLLLVSTLVATVTFAAGFTMPGGYNNSAPDQAGQATMLNKRAFQTFVICDTIAMYSAIIVAVTLIWAQLGDLHLVISSLTLAIPLLGLSLTTMSTAFSAGVWLVISNVSWLSQLILIAGIVFLSIILLLFIPLFFPNSSKNIVMRYISYYLFFKLMLIASGSNDHEHHQDLAA